MIQHSLAIQMMEMADILLAEVMEIGISKLNTHYITYLNYSMNITKRVLNNE